MEETQNQEENLLIHKVNCETIKLDEQRLKAMAKPKKNKLKTTLQDYQELMSAERQRRIRCELGLKPKNRESAAKPKVLKKSVEEQMRDAAELVEQIERKVTEDVIDEIVCELAKKLPKMIASRQDHLIMTSNIQKLQTAACEIVFKSCGPPRNNGDMENYRNFSGLIGDSIVNTVMQSMSPIKVCTLSQPKQLKAVENNQELLKIASNLMRKIAQFSKLAENNEIKHEAAIAGSEENLNPENRQH